MEARRNEEKRFKECFREVVAQGPDFMRLHFDSKSEALYLAEFYSENSKIFYSRTFMRWVVILYR